jgi:hypothetical protein
MKKCVIIARYNEDISWVSNLNCDYIIYNKGDNISIPCKNLPNKGREAHTYVNYIVENYYNLPDIVAFVQGNPFDHCVDVISRINLFNSDIDILCDRVLLYEDSRIYFSNLNNQEYMNDFSNDLFSEPFHENNQFGAGAQYILRKEFITSKSYDWWCKCLIYFSDDVHSFFKSKEIRDIGVPHIFERAWLKIWNYKIK